MCDALQKPRDFFLFDGADSVKDFSLWEYFYQKKSCSSLLKRSFNRVL